MPRRATPLAWPLLLLAALLVACSGDGEPAATATATPGAATATPTGDAEPTSTPQPTAAASPTAPAAEGACGASLLQPGSADAAALGDLPGRIAFVCDGQVWTMRPDGSDQTRLTEPQAIDWDKVRLFRQPEEEPPSDEERAALEDLRNTSPRWLDGTHLVYASIRDTLALSAAAVAPRRPFVGATELYVYDTAINTEQRISDFNLSEGSYASTAGGNFDPAAECLGENFCFAGLLAVHPTSAAGPGEFAARMVEIRFSECCFLIGRLIDDGSTWSLVTDRPAPIAGEERRVTLLDWADDGTLLAQVDFQDEENIYRTELSVHRGETSQAILSTGPGLPLEAFAGASISGSAEMIAFCAGPSAQEPWRLYVVPAAGGEPRELLSLPAGGGQGAAVASFASPSVCVPRWAPDDSHVVLNTADGEVWVVEVESSHAVRVARGTQPDWSPGE